MADQKIRVIVRKRPRSKKEQKRGDIDILSQRSPHTMVVREQKQKVDLTKFIEEHHFTFDGVFSEEIKNEQLYAENIQPLVQAAFHGTKVTCFAYGQTGSGKTFTMMGESRAPGMYVLASQDIFNYRDSFFPGIRVTVSFYEIYCNKLHDLLNNRNQLFAREDGRQNVVVAGLTRKEVNDVESLMHYINFGLGARTTGQTGANDDSSRSHAVLEIVLREGKIGRGKMTFIDLAGSERGADTSNSDAKTRLDGAEINKSLLALKECIRALDQDKKHTPFRGSKLTLVLKDSFVGNCKTVMIGNVSPCLSSCEHTLNTLRYADRVKELKKDGSGGPKDPNAALMLPRQNKNVVRYDYKEDDDENDYPIFQQSVSETSLSKPTPPSDFGFKPPETKPTFGFKNGGNNLNHKPQATAQMVPQTTPQMAPQIPPRPEPTPAQPSIDSLSQENITILLNKEESLIGAHKQMLNDMVDLINHQMTMLSEVDKPGSDVQKYVESLEKALGLKEAMISQVRTCLDSFKIYLKPNNLDTFDIDSMDTDLV